MPNRKIESHVGQTLVCQKFAKVFAALGDRTRLQLVERLAERGPASITQLSEGANMSRQAVTKHLRILESAGINRCRKRGREVLWELNPQRLTDAQEMIQRLSQGWDNALSRLQAFVED